MSKLVIGLAAFVLLAAGGALAGGAISDSSPDLPAATTGAFTGATSTTADGTTSTETGEDLSGPCDEAEHADDPRCTGGTITAEDDAENNAADDDGPHRGRGRGGEEHDRSGSNSGRG